MRNNRYWAHPANKVSRDLIVLRLKSGSWGIGAFGALEHWRCPRVHLVVVSVSLSFLFAWMYVWCKSMWLECLEYWEVWRCLDFQNIWFKCFKWFKVYLWGLNVAGLVWNHSRWFELKEMLFECLEVYKIWLEVNEISFNLFECLKTSLEV